MRRGYVFSLLIALLLGFFMLTAHYYLLERPERDVYPHFVAAREVVTGSIAADVASEFPAVERGAHTIITEESSAGGLDTAVATWGSFLALYESATLHNASIDATNSSSLATKLWLAGRGVDYVRDGSSFTLGHSGSYLLVNNTMGEVNYSSCPLDLAGSVETRIIIDTADTGAKYTSQGTSYVCFVNFTGGGSVNITIDAQNQLSIDYSSAPSNYTQRIGFDGPDKLYVVFDKYNVSLGASPGWNETFAGTKKYGTAGGINFVVADTDNDTNYDYAFADVDGDGGFGGVDDRWYLKEGVAGLGGKVFYIRFDLAGNWLVLYNALGVRSLSSWRGVVL
ncbi:MAG: hypothetical protein KAW41_01380 [Candidatus Diapherotrites archaeon]|nr:hypothetical protein [Candidatus Diapherotrites archaeon]